MTTRKSARPSHLGAKLFLTVGLGLLLAGIWVLASTLHLQLEWKSFQLQFAACAYDAKAENGYLKATSSTEVVAVAPQNVTSLFKMVQTAKAGSIGKLKDPVEQIALEYSNGASGTLSLTGDGRVHLALTDLSGKQWRFYLGSCNFRSLSKILSAEGAAVENELWSD